MFLYCKTSFQLSIIECTTRSNKSEHTREDQYNEVISTRLRLEKKRKEKEKKEDSIGYKLTREWLQWVYNAKGLAIN